MAMSADARRQYWRDRYEKKIGRKVRPRLSLEERKARKRETRRLWVLRNRERVKRVASEYRRAWRLENPDKYREIKRRARRRYRLKKYTERPKVIRLRPIKVIVPDTPENLASQRLVISRRQRVTRMAWLEANRERYLERKRLSRKAHKAANPEKYKSYERTRRARKRGSAGRHTGDDVLRILLLQRKRCAYCRRKVSGGYHVDHIVPLALGGGNDPANIQVTCSDCNIRKSAKDPVEFSRSLGLLI
jgi:5-methylcytosine-specific restriction endonuclease McrA